MEATTSSQTENAYLRLREDLLTCRIKPGQKLIIADITTRLDINLGAVREALSRLTSEGLVTSKSQKGFRAAPMSLADLLDLTDTRIKIENLCLESAILAGDLEWETRIVASYHRLARTSEFEKEGSDIVSEVWAAAHSDFHTALVAACRSDWLLKLRALLYAQSERYRRFSIPLRVSDQDFLEKHRTMRDKDHKILMEATLSRDVSDAKKTMSAHLQHTADLIKNFARSGGDGDLAIGF